MKNNRTVRSKSLTNGKIELIGLALVIVGNIIYSNAGTLGDAGLPFYLVTSFLGLFFIVYGCASGIIDRFRRKKTRKFAVGLESNEPSIALIPKPNKEMLGSQDLAYTHQYVRSSKHRVYITILTCFIAFLILVLIVVILILSLQSSNNEVLKPSETSLPATSNLAKKTLVDSEIILGINSERQKVGSGNLSYSSMLVNAANSKTVDMITSGDFSIGNSSSITSYLANAGYEVGYAQIWIQQIATQMSSDEVVSELFKNTDSKEQILDGRYKDIGVAIKPVNKNGITSVVVIYTAFPQAPTPVRTYVPAPTTVNCTSNYIGNTIYTSCY